jgi:hypothetical protein
MAYKPFSKGPRPFFLPFYLDSCLRLCYHVKTSSKKQTTQDGNKYTNAHTKKDLVI